MTIWNESLSVLSLRYLRTNSLSYTAKICLILMDEHQDQSRGAVRRNRHPRTVPRASADGSCVWRIGWVIEHVDAAARHTAESLRPELLICDYRKLPATADALWPGPWHWALYDICEPALARQWLQRGAAFIETWDIGGMLAALDLSEC